MSAAVSQSMVILVWVTSRFEAMADFFSDLGLKVCCDKDGYSQLTPRVNSGRGCVVDVTESMMMSIEESVEHPPCGALYLELHDFEESHVARLGGKYKIEKVPGFLYGGEHYTVVPPDGGLVRLYLD